LPSLGQIQSVAVFGGSRRGAIRSLDVANDGTLWGSANAYSSYEPKIFSYNPVNGSCSIWDVSGSLASGAGHIANSPLVVHPNGSIFIGGGRVLEYNPATDILTEAWSVQEAAMAMIVASDGSIWTSSNKGQLSRHHPDGNVSGASGFVQGIGSNAINTEIWSLTEGADGLIYGGTYGGIGQGWGGHLFIYDPTNGEFTDKGEIFAGSNGIQSLATGTDGKIYGSTYGAGSGIGGGRAFVYDPSTGDVNIIFDLGGGSSPIVVEAAADGSIYFSKQKELFSYHPSTQSLVSIGKLPDWESNAFVVSSDGKFYGGSETFGHVYTEMNSSLPNMNCSRYSLTVSE